MEFEVIIQEILSKNPEVSRKQILESLDSEKNKTAGLIADITLLRVIAARYDVQISQNQILDQRLPIRRLVPGLNNVTVAGRIVTLSPPRTYEGKKPGRFANLTLIDEEGIVRVTLWNSKVDSIESGNLKVGQMVRFVHGYTREDRDGKPELHIGERSEIKFEPEEEKGNQKHFICKFTAEIKDIARAQNNVHLRGTAKRISPATDFTRKDNTTGKVLRFDLADETGEVTVVVWNEQAEELEKSLEANSIVQLINARTKATQNGNYEIHVDQHTYVEILAQGTT